MTVFLPLSNFARPLRERQDLEAGDRIFCPGARRGPCGIGLQRPRWPASGEAREGGLYPRFPSLPQSEITSVCGPRNVFRSGAPSWRSPKSLEGNSEGPEGEGGLCRGKATREVPGTNAHSGPPASEVHLPPPGDTLLELGMGGEHWAN